MAVFWRWIWRRNFFPWLHSIARRQAFGCLFRLRGFEFGPGLAVSSLFFGLIHSLNTVDYFHGNFDFGWWYGVQNLFTGLFFGLIRARTGSVLPGAIVRGLQDAFARIPGPHA